MLAELFRRSRISQSKLLLLQACPWKQVELPSELSEYPTMLWHPELQVLHWLAKHYVTGEGRIVDAGCFLGGSTAALATGLASRTDQSFDKAIASYDLFRVEPYTLGKFQEKLTEPTVGASFRSDFDRYIAPWSNFVEVREGDAIKHGWTGEPIEVLFLDVLKTWELNDFMMDQFLPSLIPGHTVIIQQDYNWGWAPWIHITMEVLAPYVEVLDSMLCSVVYVLTRPIPKKLFGAKLQSRLSGPEKMALMNRAVERWTGPLRGQVELARVILIRELFTAETAQDELQRVLARYDGEEAIETSGKQVAAFIGHSQWWAK